MGILDNIKEVADFAKKVGDIELYRKIVHLEGEVIELTRENRQADQKIEDLQKQLTLKAKMTFRQPFYYQDGDAVPFCPRCFEKDTRSMHLVRGGDDSVHSRWDCKECKQVYLIEHGGPQPHVAWKQPGPWS